ncbi:sensor histidine kinase [Geoalkalibacter sp.]|uniref:sensor histidine kinase n=1 Tax=Geoalkalibacter sp. TaxID=3041440 RepID=UPI00272EB5ED|nr:ATP-binding protein [Geoalkalibacter sp.]
MIARASHNSRKWLTAALLTALAFLPPAAQALEEQRGNARPTRHALLLQLGLPALGAGVLLAYQRRRLRALKAQLADQEQRLAAGLRDQEHAQRRFQQLLDHAGDAIFFIDPKDGRLLLVNRQAEEMLGYSAGEIQGQALTALFPGRHERRYLRLMRRVLRDGYGEEPNLHLRHKNGQRLIGAVQARLGRFDEETVVHGAIRDVTRVRLAEQQLRRKNRELTLLNEIARRIAGHRRLDELLQTILEDVIHVFEAHGGGIFLVQQGGNDLHLAAHRNIEPEVLEDIRRVPPGTGMAARVAATGQPQGSADLQNDLRLRSQAIRNAGWRGFQAIPLHAQEQTVGVLFLYNRDHRVLSREEVHLLLAIGHQVGSAIQGAELYEALRWQNRLTEAGNRELERSRRQLRDNLDQAQRHNRELARLERMKSNFMALASHELRTPLTCILSGTQLLAQQLGERLDADERQLFGAIQQGGARLESIVRDMLEAARLESDSLYLAREKIDLGTILGAVHGEFQPILEERRLNFHLHPLPSGVELTGDAYHLRRTFGRLLENAIKFTPTGGGIEIRGQLRCFAELHGDRERLTRFSPTFFADTLGGPLIQITVADSGIGIAPEEQLRIFDKFYEVGDIDAHFSSRTDFGGKGVGLGLTLVKGMIEAHGGMVWVESPPAGGSAFHVLLPAALSGGAEAGP